MAQPNTCTMLACHETLRLVRRLTKVIFCHSAQLWKNSLPGDVPKAMFVIEGN
jgi:hypothetical protein